MPRKPSPSRRSGCPISIALDLLGDRWSLLLVRDMMVRGYRTFREFQHSGEGIATNILSDRLQKLEASDILIREDSADDGRSAHYRLTGKGIALAPVLLEMLIWSGRYEETGAPCAVIHQMEQNRAAVLAETYRRWDQRDPTPILPPFGPRASSSAPAKARSRPAPTKSAKGKSKR